MIKLNDIVVKFGDFTALHNINVHVKEGEFFVGTEKDLHVVDKVKNLFVTIFQYVLGRVENVSFEVYVKDDIFTPDQAGIYAVWTNSAGKVSELKRGPLIETVTTNAFGLATVENLPLGTYYLKERAADDGYFLLNQEEKEVLLSYVDQDTPVVFPDSISYVNERQTIQISLHKKETGTESPLAGAVFGLYAGEDLRGYVVNGEKVVSKYPEPLVLKDTLLETIETDENGQAVFTADVPNGMYYVRELQAPQGYAVTGEVWYFDASYQGPDGEEILCFEQVVYNEPSDMPQVPEERPEEHPDSSDDSDSSDEPGPTGSASRESEPVVAPMTGDPNHWAGWISALLLSVIAITWFVKRRR